MKTSMKISQDQIGSWREYLPNVPRWARVSAHVIALCTIPAALWRIGITIGIPLGYDQDWIRRSQLDSPFGVGRMILLSVVSELLALLAFGLVQRWGEIMPPWTLALRGRRIPAWLPTVLAMAGAIGLTMIWTVGVIYAALTGVTFDAETPPGLPVTVQLVAYAPMVVWGPLLLALAAHYRKRRSGTHGRELPTGRTSGRACRCFPGAACRGLRPSAASSGTASSSVLPGHEALSAIGSPTPPRSMKSQG